MPPSPSEASSPACLEAVRQKPASSQTRRGRRGCKHPCALFPRSETDSFGPRETLSLPAPQGGEHHNARAYQEQAGCRQERRRDRHTTGLGHLLSLLGLGLGLLRLGIGLLGLGLGLLRLRHLCLRHLLRLAALWYHRLVLDLDGFGNTSLLFGRRLLLSLL